MDFERQAYHFPAANVSQKRAAIDIADEGHQIKKRLAASEKKAPPGLEKEYKTIERCSCNSRDESCQWGLKTETTIAE